MYFSTFNSSTSLALYMLSLHELSQLKLSGQLRMYFHHTTNAISLPTLWILHILRRNGDNHQLGITLLCTAVYSDLFVEAHIFSVHLRWTNLVIQSNRNFSGDIYSPVITDMIDDKRVVVCEWCYSIPTYEVE